MPQVFAALAISNVLLLLLTGGLGLYGQGGVNTDRHVLMSVLTLVFSCLVQVVVFTYFTVTGKLIAQAVHLGGLGDEHLTQVRRLKKSVTRCVGLAVTTIVVTTATGAVHWRTAQWSTLHVACAAAMLLVTAVVLYREMVFVLTNVGLLNRTLGQYERMRKPRSADEKSVAGRTTG